MRRTTGKGCPTPYKLEREIIDSKPKMYRMLQAGTLGNTIRFWDSRQAVEASGYRGEFSLRSQQVSNPVRKYHVPYGELDSTLAALPDDQRNSQIIFCESPPEHRKIIQGELCRDPELYFEYTTIPLPMRIAFDKERIPVKGLRAKMLLQAYLVPHDLDDLWALLDIYPGHVIEFSTFDCCVGTIPGRKTVTWEVRRY